MNRIRLPLKLLATAFMALFAVNVYAGILEYWFDNTVVPKQISFSGSSAVVDANIDTKALTDGFHNLCLRVRSNDGKYSPVSTSSFIKFTAGEASMLEFWFDNNFALRMATPLNLSANGIASLNLDLSNDFHFPVGFHKLNMRISANGSQYSSIYSAYVIKLDTKGEDVVSYWLDDDIENRRAVKGTLQNGTVILSTTLDFSDSSSGMHMLKFRLGDVGVIYQMPILVKSLYNTVDKATIVQASHWADNIEQTIVALNTPQEVYTQELTLDPAQYEVGTHVFYVQYKNSASVWSEANATYFYKERKDGPLRPGVPVGIEEIDLSEVNCYYHDGKIIVDGDTPSQTSTCNVTIHDVSGQLLAAESVVGQEVLHAEFEVENHANQMVIVKIASGQSMLVKKMLLR